MADEFDNDSEIEFATFEAAVDGDDEAAAVQAAEAEFGEFGDELVIDVEPDIAVPVVAIVGPLSYFLPN